jgi:nucleoredoxin
MSALSKLIGEKVLSGGASETKTSVFEGSGKVLGLYFSAHWCPPCRAFTPQLAQWYRRVKKSGNGEKFDIVFLSSDRDEAQFREYFEEMPWHALPYEDRERKNSASRKFKVSGIPTLVFLNAENGSVITVDGRTVVMDDADGNEFPWTPKPVLELLSGELKAPEKGSTTWDDVHKNVDYIGIYFSAHWCGPCRTFTPQLVETYKRVKDAGKNFEIIFCSSDREEEAFEEYYATMPWLALPFGDSRKKSLSRKFEVTGIPTLVILDKEGKLVTASGRAAISGDLEGKEYPWRRKLVDLLTGINAADINENTSIVWFTDGSKEGLASAEKAMEAVAVEYYKEKTNEDPTILFFYTNPKEEEHIAQSLRSFARIPDKIPVLVVLDIPQQKQYLSSADVIDEKAVREMVEGYKADSLEGMPLLK